MTVQPTLAAASTGGAQPSRPPAIDLDHLATQSMGDRAVEREVLAMFAGQARRCMDELAQADEAGRKAIAHRLLGSARAVGAYAVADAAEALEDRPDSRAQLAALGAAVLEAERFILEHCA
ncbi:MAG TPA: Hpt domain-containing protein [Mycoplana sp.]|nr:Hpt domain-containing protein [Mycoplana sp.]